MVAKFEGFDLRSECFEQQVVVRVVQFSHYRVVVIKEPELNLLWLRIFHKNPWHYLLHFLCLSIIENNR